jgi:hypothetical protein
MDDNVILHISTSKFLLTPDEAMTICNTLNSANRIEQTWMKGVDSDKNNVIKPPGFATYVTPVTAILQMEITANMKIQEAAK